MIEQVSFTSAALSGSDIVVTGTVTGSPGSRGEVQVSVTQGHGRDGAEGDAALAGDAYCTGAPAEWTVTVPAKKGAFTSGEVILVIRGNSFDARKEGGALHFDGGTHIRVKSTV